MSKFNQCLLAGSIALAVAGTAVATGSIDLETPRRGQFAWNVTGGTAPDPTANASRVRFNVAAPDILIGRTDATGQITVEAVITGAVLRNAVVAADIDPQGTAVIDTVSAAAGASAFQFTMTPPGGAGIAAGSLFRIDPIELEAATALATLGGSVTIAFTVKDTTTGTVLSSAPATPILTSVEATQLATTPGGGTIDVFDPSLKREFDGTGTVVTLGSVAVARTDVDPVAGGIQSPWVQGTGAAGNANPNVFVYDTAGDAVELTLTVPDAGGFQGAGNGFFAQNAACSDPAGGAAVAFTVDPMDSTKYTASRPFTGAGGANFNICGIASGTDEIAAQTIGLSAQVNLDGALTRNPPAVNTPAFAVLDYNGPVVEVQSFNPASNPSVDSLLRVLNTSGVGGVVSIDSVCQDGATRGPISFTLPGNNQVQYSSAELESGSAGAGKPTLTGGLGPCASGGRSQLTITGQIPTMEVQNFLRSSTSAGVVTGGHNNED